VRGGTILISRDHPGRPKNMKIFYIFNMLNLIPELKPAFRGSARCPGRWIGKCRDRAIANRSTPAQYAPFPVIGASHGDDIKSNSCRRAASKNGGFLRRSIDFAL
jgi:hypothetical protein